MSIDFLIGRESSCGYAMVGQSSSVRTVRCSAVSINSIVTVDGKQNSGEIGFSLSRVGATETFAIEFVSKNYQQWVLIAGRTGQAIFLDSEDDVQTAFKQMRLEGA